MSLQGQYDPSNIFAKILRGEMPRWRRSRSLSIDLALDNIWDVSYSNIAYRPMPGRNWRAGIVFGW